MGRIPYCGCSRWNIATVITTPSSPLELGAASDADVAQYLTHKLQSQHYLLQFKTGPIHYRDCQLLRLGEAYNYNRVRYASVEKYYRSERFAILVQFSLPTEGLFRSEFPRIEISANKSSAEHVATHPAWI